jgi:hypothetical protein
MMANGGADIGAQLHPWVTPPHDEQVTTRNSFAGNLSEPLERAKIEALTKQIMAATGVAPRSYRAGRYGIGANTARALTDNGYHLDVSIRSLFSYSHESGPDFSTHSIAPWWVGSQKQLLELPLTAVYTGLFREQGSWLFGAVSRIKLLEALFARGLLNRVALTPEGMPAKEVLEAIDVLDDSGCQFYSLSYHSPSIVPGHTPYVRDGDDLKRFWQWWDLVFNHFAKKSIMPMRSLDFIEKAFATRR